MSAIDKRITELAFMAFAKIGELSRSGKAGNAMLVLATIETIVEAVLDARARKISPAELEALIAKKSEAFADKLSGNKTTILSEIDKKFPT